MGIRLSEHKAIKIQLTSDEVESDDNRQGCLSLDEPIYTLLESVVPKLFNSGNCFSISKNEKDNCYSVQADYYIGIDWLGNSGRYIYVEPKINKHKTSHFIESLSIEEEQKEQIIESDKRIEQSITKDENYVELDYIKMLLEIMSVSQSAKEVNRIIQIYWEEKPISIQQQDDKLTPFLVVQFLQLLKAIVRKGLKKSYYRVQENLNNRIKGKILVGQHIKQNIFKNCFTKNYCEYQVFGEDTIENRFLKKVFGFCSSYVENNKEIFKNNFEDIQNIINYCSSVFEHISDTINDYQLKTIKHNPFFKEYKEAIKIGEYILKRFAYNITQTTQTRNFIPPFWIDMPLLFELYVYQKLLKANPDKKYKIKYQFSTYGNALDILITDGDNSMIIDAKYKLHYKHSQIHQDIRQVAGYARLNKVLDVISKEHVNFDQDKILPCLIIYPETDDNNCSETSLRLEDLINMDRKIKAYHKVYKLGIPLPLIKN